MSAIYPVIVIAALLVIGLYFDSAASVQGVQTPTATVTIDAAVDTSPKAEVAHSQGDAPKPAN